MSLVHYKGHRLCSYLAGLIGVAMSCHLSQQLVWLVFDTHNHWGSHIHHASGRVFLFLSATLDISYQANLPHQLLFCIMHELKGYIGTGVVCQGTIHKGWSHARSLRVFLNKQHRHNLDPLTLRLSLRDTEFCDTVSVWRDVFCQASGHPGSHH